MLPGYVWLGQSGHEISTKLEVIYESYFFESCLQVIANNSSTVLSKAVVHEIAVHKENCPQITIYYPSDTLWYYIVPSLNSKFVTVKPKEPSADLVQKYMHWSYNPF